jgi:rhamnogalacturonan endolyase
MRTHLLLLLFFQLAASVHGQPSSQKTGDWLAEFEKPSASSLNLAENSIEIRVAAGATVWYTKKLSGNIKIEYTLTVIDSGGVNDRVSDMNAFWMASDPKKETPFGRDGKFSSYDDLLLYYAGVGGHDNTTTRFRKYEPGKGKDVLQEFLDKKHLLAGNTPYRIVITVKDGRTLFSVNGTLFFDYADAQPLREGYFAFRTTKSRQRIKDFVVQQLPD